jgi:hypothetical protein
MPDFTVIEGGGDGHKRIDEVLARKASVRFVIELLRALGRDADNGYQTTIALIEFIEHAGRTNAPLGHLVATEIEKLHKLAFEREGEPWYENELKAVLEAALRTTVEYLATDGLAKARRSNQIRKLTSAIESELLAKEERSRENGGWSYLKNLSDRLGKWPPPKNERKPPKR